MTAAGYPIRIDPVAYRAQSAACSYAAVYHRRAHTVVMHMDEPYGDGTFALTVDPTDTIPDDDNLVCLGGTLPPRDDTHREYLLRLFADIMAKG